VRDAGLTARAGLLEAPAPSGSSIALLTKGESPGQAPRAFRSITVIDATFQGGASPDTGPVSTNVTGRIR
jgi:hypothetical protein